MSDAPGGVEFEPVRVDRVAVLDELGLRRVQVEGFDDFLLHIPADADADLPAVSTADVPEGTPRAWPVLAVESVIASSEGFGSVCADRPRLWTRSSVHCDGSNNAKGFPSRVITTVRPSMTCSNQRTGSAT
ncbi:hypothetical protein [Curtobacterium sp. PhB136]|uniref:hypothetical protein n=1 Tax=Curtobacterium sp. PhB136 TaxID=2485181 RepID=UPI00104BF439|nr:hypothetical protein [Curtobacterium sp. PhB136]